MIATGAIEMLVLLAPHELVTLRFHRRARISTAFVSFVPVVVGVRRLEFSVRRKRDICKRKLPLATSIVDEKCLCARTIFARSIHRIRAA